jgi:hypothetical protein
MHVYANPLYPEICPVLAIAVLFFCTSFRNTPQLFEGNLQNKRYCKILARALASLNAMEKSQLGSSGTAESIGTHSNRKGAASYAMSFPGISNVISVLLRAKWKLGGTRDRYTRHI